MWANNSGRVTWLLRSGSWIGVAAAAGLTVTGTLTGCSSSTAQPESPDVSYLREVHAAAVPFGSDEVAIKVGQGMCELIERAVLSGQTVADAKTILKQQSDNAGVYSNADNTTIIVAAVSSYCPEYTGGR